MDKKNTAIGISLIVAAIGLFVWNGKKQADYERAHPKPVAAPAKVAEKAPAPAVVAAKETAAVAADPVRLPERILTLENGVVRARITTDGAGVKSVALLEHASELGKDKATSPVLFNEFGKIPAFAVSFPDAEGKPVAWEASFVVKEQTPARLVLEAKRGDGLVITRTFSFPTAAEAGKKADEKIDAHLIRVVTTFRREGGDAAKPVVAALNLGCLPPSESDPHNIFLNFSAFDGSAYEKFGLDKFAPSGGFLSERLPAPEELRIPGSVKPFEKPFIWFASANQFFTGIATFDAADRAAVSGFYVRPVVLPESKFPRDQEGVAQRTVTGDVELTLGALKPGESKVVGVNWFVGPKEYARLASLGEGQEHVVQFSKVFGVLSIDWLCSGLMSALSGLHWVLVKVWPSNSWNWGWAIVMLTVIVKALTWPLTAMQLKSAENMKKLQKPMEELKKKYKDNPQKQQQEMMRLYKEHRVNPAAGCLPVLIQIPIFAGLFYAFQTCAELRHHPFLWFHDLSVADKIPGLPDLYIGYHSLLGVHFGPTIGLHILPILMGLAMFVNMRMTPMGNVDPNQKTIFYMMMFVFPVMCYSSPAGLTTYWTVSNSLTLLQTWRRKKKTAAAAALAGPEVEVIPPERAKPVKKKK